MSQTKLQHHWVSSRIQGRRPLYYFTGASSAMKVIKNNSIKLSDFGRCNDIFELAHFSLRDRTIRSSYHQWKASIQAAFGFVCFSEEWQNPLMWGHYAENGAGMCMVFDVASTNLQKVEYVPSGRMPLPPKRFPMATDPDFRKFCSKKSNHWSYESEFRLFVDLSMKQILTAKGKNDEEIKLLPLNEELELVGVINGPRNENKVIDVRKEISGKYYVQSRAAFGDYKVTVQLDQSKWT